LTIPLLWIILFYGWTASEIILVIVTRTRRSGGQVRDRGSLLLLWGAIFGTITATNWVDHWVHAPMFPGTHWPRYAALGLMIAGLGIRWTAILSLGKAFSVNVAIRDKQTLYRSGLYRFVRHPSYTGLVVCLVAVAFAGRNWAGAALVLVPTTAALVYRMHVEEKALQGAFGDAYRAYSQTTKRLIPGIY
jgi:protein-S-isoprenylcysteine O-methyltransferase Ste14